MNRDFSYKNMPCLFLYVDSSGRSTTVLTGPILGTGVGEQCWCILGINAYLFIN